MANLNDVRIIDLKRYPDERGWLSEFWRTSESNYQPMMGYLSITKPGQSRGPHEHIHQTDYFVFMNGKISLVLATKDGHNVIEVGELNPVAVIVPPGIIHGYRNVGSSDALILNLPDRLYRGASKKEPVDEIRHEEIGSYYHDLANQIWFP